MRKTSSNSCLNKNSLFHTSNITKKLEFPNRLTNSVRSSVNERDDYCQFVVSDLPNIIHFIERSQNKIKYTPKVTIHTQQNSAFRILIQCPKRLLIQYLSRFDEVIKAEIVQQIVETLFILSERYGYFYCDRFMFKMSEERRPVVWINQNFKINQPQFPIQINSISESKFINKIIKTFSQMIQFTKTTEIVTKQQLREYLKQFVQKCKSQEKKRQLMAKTKRSQKKNIYRKQYEKMDVRTISPKIRVHETNKLIQTPRHKTTQFSERILNPSQFSKSKKSLDINKNYNIKLVQNKKNEIGLINDLKNNNIIKINKSNKNLNLLIQQEMASQIKSKGLNPQTSLSNISYSHFTKNISNLQQDSDTVCSQMKQDHRQKAKNKLLPRSTEKKVRKKSEDIQMLQSWIKDDKLSNKQDIKYQNLTFSTGLTISCFKSQPQNIFDNKLDKPDDQRTGNRKGKYCQNQNQFQIQHKVNKQQDPIITITQVEIEKQMDNLFDSIHEKQQNDISPVLKEVRQSKLFKQLQILFVSTDSLKEQKQIQNEQFNQLASQFSNILN